ncbi:hypothetical protein BB559_006914, partial [Furculomyces boomerangus]
MKTIDLTYSDQKTLLSYCWFDKIDNKNELLTLISNRDQAVKEMVLIDAQMITAEHTLFVVSEKVIKSKKNNELKTENIYGELLYSLSPNSNIKSAFLNFGLSSLSDRILAVYFGENIEQFKKNLESIGLISEWNPSDFELQKHSNIEKLAK